MDASELRGFGPAGILAMLVILLAGNLKVGSIPAVPAGALLVVAWAQLSETPWRAIGYVRPGSWAGAVAGGIAFGVAFKLVMKAVVMPLLGAAGVNPAYHFLAGNRALLPPAIWAMVVAGFGEETVFRGYLFERSFALFGPSRVTKIATVLVTAGIFAMAHYVDQGLAGVEQAAITGLVFGAVFAATGRIVPLMVAHAAFDLTALAIIYWDVEARLAHLIFP
jgi:uncharacterized protein